MWIDEGAKFRNRIKDFYFSIQWHHFTTICHLTSCCTPCQVLIGLIGDETHLFILRECVSELSNWFLRDNQKMHRCSLVQIMKGETLQQMGFERKTKNACEYDQITSANGYSLNCLSVKVRKRLDCRLEYECSNTNSKCNTNSNRLVDLRVSSGCMYCIRIACLTLIGRLNLLPRECDWVISFPLHASFNLVT